VRDCHRCGFGERGGVGMLSDAIVSGHDLGSYGGILYSQEMGRIGQNQVKKYGKVLMRYFDATER
jgi:hypothetical protein